MACRAVVAAGNITDKQKTITALVEASSEPVSVIIVGVGDEDFEEMELLDGDAQGLVSEDGVRAQRDIVQFVAFKECLQPEELWQPPLDDMVVLAPTATLPLNIPSLSAALGASTYTHRLHWTFR